MDGFITTLAERIDATTRAIAVDEKEIKKLETEIAAQHARTVKLSQQIDEKKRIRDETRELLKQAETQYDEVQRSDLPRVCSESESLL